MPAGVGAVLQAVAQGSGGYGGRWWVHGGFRRRCERVSTRARVPKRGASARAGVHRAERDGVRASSNMESVALLAKDVKDRSVASGPDRDTRPPPRAVLLFAGKGLQRSGWCALLGPSERSTRGDSPSPSHDGVWALCGCWFEIAWLSHKKRRSTFIFPDRFSV